MGNGEGRGGNEKAWDGVFVAVICTGRVYFYYRLYNYSLTSDQKHCNSFAFVFWVAVVILYSAVLNLRLCARQFALTTSEFRFDTYTSNLK